MNSIGKLWDINPSFGGPIVRDKVWFFGTYRYQVSRQNVASMWVNRNAGNPNAWTYDPILTEQAVADGDWNNGSGRITWQVTPRNKFSAWTSMQYHCLYCNGGGDGTGLGFGAAISSPEATQTNENQPSMLTQLSWTSPYTNRLLLEANVQLGPYFWWGSRQKNPYDDTMIQVQETAGAIPNILLHRLVQLVRAHRNDEHLPGRRLVHHRVALGEVRLPLSPQHVDVPEELLQQHPARVPVHERRSQSGDGVRRPGVGAGTAADHLGVLRAGSLDAQSSVGAGRAALRASGRLLPRAADGAEPLPAHRSGLPGRGRSAQSE